MGLGRIGSQEGNGMNGTTSPLHSFNHTHEGAWPYNISRGNACFGWKTLYASLVGVGADRKVADIFLKG